MPSSEPPLPDPAALADAGDVAHAIRALFDTDALEPSGVLHVTSAWDGPRGRRAILITESSPKSAWDSFLLHLARARADVIVVTGAILRAEPSLRYELGGPGTMGRALAHHRRVVLGKADAPTLLVLTSGRDLDLSHPAFHGWARPVVLTPRGVSLPTLPSGVGRRELPEGGLRALVADEAAAGRLVSIEAGPRTSLPLYDSPPVVDELLLGLFRGALDPTLEGGLLPDDATLEARLGPPRAVRDVAEPSGPWRVLRYRR